MNSKENLLNFYRHQRIEIMPNAFNEEHSVYPINGFSERPRDNQGGKDWFGCNWIFMEDAGAPAPDPVNVLLDDICDWREVVKFPDLDAWDWESAPAIDNVADIDRENKVVDVMVLEGPWERLHTLMTFEDACCALLEEPEECEAFFERMVEYKIELIGKIKKYYNPDVISFHDDWGTQNGPFFQPETWRQMLKGRMKEIIDCAHSLGITFILHSCGKYDAIVPELPEIGVDCLQPMDIIDIAACLKETGDAMSYLPTVHEQIFKSKASAGTLTEEYVREVCQTQFMECGATGRYTPFLFPPSNWYEEIVWEEFEKCRQELKGTYTH